MIDLSQINKFLLASDVNTNKNLSSGTYDFSQSSITVGAGSYALRTYSVPLSSSTRLYQIYVNLSIDGDVWTTLPARDRLYSNNRSIAINLAQTGSSISLDVYMVNRDTASQTFAAMTVSVKRRDFVD